MGILDVAGFVVKGVAKGVGYIANEVVKEATGIDVASELRPIVEATKEGNAAYKELKEFDNNKDAYIEAYGEEAYEIEREVLQWDAEMCLDEARRTLANKKGGIYKELSEVEDQREKMHELQEKIGKLSDQQIINSLNRNDLSDEARYWIELEKGSRGL